MPDIIDKASETAIKVTSEPVIQAPVEVIYDYDFLVNQAVNIQADIDRLQADLDKINNYIQEAKALGVKSQKALETTEVIIDVLPVNP